MELDREEWKTGRKILKFIHIFIIICLQGGWVDNYTWCWRGPHLTCRSHWCQLMVKIMMMTKMMVMVTMTIMMSGKVVDLPGVDEALVWLVVLIDEKLLPALRKVRSTDCITMVLQQGKSKSREYFLDSITKRSKYHLGGHIAPPCGNQCGRLVMTAVSVPENTSGDTNTFKTWKNILNENISEHIQYYQHNHHINGDGLSDNDNDIEGDYWKWIDSLHLVGFPPCCNCQQLHIHHTVTRLWWWRWSS